MFERIQLHLLRAVVVAAIWRARGFRRLLLGRAMWLPLFPLVFKPGHRLIQIRPPGVETGLYPSFEKEHIANIEQIVYIGISMENGRNAGRAVRL
jgi:hypothetical protein